MKIKPAENHILIKLDNAEETTEGGIILPYTEEAMPTGEIVAMGPRVTTRTEVQKNELQLKVGDKIMFNGGLGTVRSEGLPCALIKRCHVVAVVEAAMRVGRKLVVGVVAQVVLAPVAVAEEEQKVLLADRLEIGAGPVVIATDERR